MARVMARSKSLRASMVIRLVRIPRWVRGGKEGPLYDRGKGVRARLTLLCTRAARPTTDLTAYDATLRGKRCADGYDQQADCEYRVGRSLHFEIAGVGLADASVTFHKVDWDKDYYPTFGTMHGCVIVKTNPSCHGHWTWLLCRRETARSTTTGPPASRLSTAQVARPQLTNTVADENVPLLISVP